MDNVRRHTSAAEQAAADAANSEQLGTRVGVTHGHTPLDIVRSHVPTPGERVIDNTTPRGDVLHSPYAPARRRLTD